MRGTLITTIAMTTTMIIIVMKTIVVDMKSKTIVINREVDSALVATMEQMKS